MISRSIASDLAPGFVLPQILHELNVVAAAIIGRDGILEEANPGFLRLLPEGVKPGTLQDVRGNFINPRFDQFAAKGAGGDYGTVYRGIVNIGDAMGTVRSLRGRICGLEDKLLVVAEPDLAGIERSLAMLELVNDQLSAERRKTTENTVPYGGRSSANEKRSRPSVGSAPAEHCTARPISAGPKVPSRRTPNDSTADDIGGTQIPVHVAIALLRIGRNFRSRTGSE